MISSDNSILKARWLQNTAVTGLTLAEMMISMGLIGAVLIPMLFISSAVFLRQISDSRENVDVVQNASHVLNLLTNDLQKVHRILPGSSTSEVHYASYDERTGKEALRGFRITLVSGSNYKLERIDYNSSSDTWMAKSPYGPLSADDITLQKTGGGAPAFGYCLDITCTGQTSVSANPEKAVLLQLDDWVFTRGADSNSITLPDVNIHLASDSSMGGYLLSEGVRELYTIDTTLSSSFGSGAALSSLSLTPGGGQFNYPDQAGGGWELGSSGTLSTVVNGGSNWGLGLGYQPETYTTAVSPSDSRVFMGADSNPGAFLTWKDGVLSTIVSSVERPCVRAIAVDSEGRVFCGEGGASGDMWTWKDGILSTIVTGMNSPGGERIYVSSDDALYFSSQVTKHVWRWKDNILSTLTPSTGGDIMYRAVTENPADGRMFFGSGLSGGYVLTWKDNILSTVLSSWLNTSVDSIKASSDSRVFFGSGVNTFNNNCAPGGVNGPFWTWKDNVLSTIVTSETMVGCGSTTVTPSGRAFFSEVANPGTMWTWKDNILSTLYSSNVNSQWATVSGSDDSVYWSNGSRMMRWKDGVLSTLTPSSVTNVGFHSLTISPLDDRIFFGGDSPDGFWTWKDNVLTTIAIGGTLNSPGHKSTRITPFGRVYYGDLNESGGGRFWSWHDATGLSTINPIAPPWKGYGSEYGVRVSTLDGRVYFGSNSNYMWTWHDGTVAGSGGNVIRADSSGNKNNQDVTVAAASTYDLSAQDINGEFYFMNNTDGELHRYTYASGSYTLNSSFTMGGFASDVVAMAIDQAEDTIAFLDKDGSQPTIQIYANRKASSTPALTTRSLGALGSSEPDNPTGMAINGRTGDFLIIDSDRKGANPNYYVNLLVVDPTVSRVKKTFKIYTKNTNTKIPISFDASNETNFKLHYDDAKNIIYLVSPSTEKIITMTLPEYLE